MNNAPKSLRFLITGVGGQGTILASDILAEVGLRLGYDTKKSDILGLAIRGGAVVSHVLWGTQVAAPLLDTGTADFYLSFEWLEGLRRLAYTHSGTVVLANDWRIDPVSVSSGQAEYPDVAQIRDRIAGCCAALHVVPATPLAIELGNSRVFNSVLMGRLASLIHGEDAAKEPVRAAWEGAVACKVPAKARELNLRAFQTGQALA